MNDRERKPVRYYKCRDTEQRARKTAVLNCPLLNIQLIKERYRGYARTIVSLLYFINLEIELFRDNWNSMTSSGEQSVENSSQVCENRG